MTKRLGFKSWATGAVVLAAVAACGGNSTDPPSTAPTPTPTTATTSASSTSPSDRAAAHGTGALRHYFVVLDEVRRDDSARLARLASVATSTQLTAEKHLITSEREKGLRQTGVTKLDELTVQSVNLDNSDPAAGKVPTVTIDACWDVSGADLVDQDGKSAVSPTRPARGWTRYTVANYDWATNPSAGWRISSSQDLKQAPCAAS
jgi:hypothetical protein